MIPVIETEVGFQPVSGNPVLTSLDGETRAPLAVIMHPSWSAEDRAKYGVFLVEPAEIPDGKEAVGLPRYERDKKGKIVQVRETRDEVKQKPLTAEDKVSAMLARHGLTIEEFQSVTAKVQK